MQEWKIAASQYYEQYPGVDGKIVRRKLRDLAGYKVSRNEFYKYWRELKRGEE